MVRKRVRIRMRRLRGGNTTERGMRYCRCRLKRRGEEYSGPTNCWCSSTTHDKVAGLSDELKLLAQRKSKEITTAAYQQACIVRVMR